MYRKVLYKLKIENNLSSNNIADILNIDRTTYTHYEKEDDFIPIKHLNTLCNYYNVSLDYIFEFSNNKQYNNLKTNIDNKLSGLRLKEFRKENKLTLDQFSKSLNCSYGTIAGYESGRYLIATPFLYTICKKYNISADYLLGKIDNPKYLS